MSELVLPNLFRDVVGSMKVPNTVNGGFFNINFQSGRELQILEQLQKLNESRTMKNSKYPLVALYLPIVEKKDPLGQYSSSKIKRITFACSAQPTDTIEKRFATGGTFDTILYPMYHEFMRCLAAAPSVLSMSIDSFVHKKMDNPGPLPVGTKGVSDFVDAVEIFDLELAFLKPIKVSGGSSGNNSNPPDPMVPATCNK